MRPEHLYHMNQSLSISPIEKAKIYRHDEPVNREQFPDLLA